MKKLLFSFVFIFSLINVQGQELEKGNAAKNAISLMVTDLIKGTNQLSYERSLGKHFSVNLGLARKSEDGLINLSGIDTDKIKTGDLTYSGFIMIPEVRYYLNNSGNYEMNGFYFGAYIKHSNFKSDLDGTYINDDSESFQIAFDAKIKVTSIGLLVGYKLALSKKFTLDFLIAGPGTGSYDFSFKNNKDLPEEFYEDFNKALENYSLFDFLDGDFRFASTSAKTKFTVPSFRYGISLGYQF
jgi:hypothetical protein